VCFEYVLTDLHTNHERWTERTDAQTSPI